MAFRSALLPGLIGLLLAAASGPESNQVGERPDGSVKLPNHQVIRPAGTQVAFYGRPADLALSPDGKTLAALVNSGLLLFAPPAPGSTTGAAPLRLALHGKAGAMGGLNWSRDGRTLYVCTRADGVEVFRRGASGDLGYAASLSPPGNAVKSNDPLPVGVALTPDGGTLLACYNRENTLAWLDCASGEVKARLSVGVAPGAVLLSPDGRTAYVAEWGGPRPGAGDRTSTTAGTAVRVDARGAVSDGSVAVVDVDGHRLVRRIRVGRHPVALALSRDGRRLYVACASDDQVVAVDPQSGRVVERILTQVDPRLPLGSMPDALALSPDGGTLYVALGGDNAVAVVRLGRVALGISDFGFRISDWPKSLRQIEPSGDHVPISDFGFRISDWPKGLRQAQAIVENAPALVRDAQDGRPFPALADRRGIVAAGSSTPQPASTPSHPLPYGRGSVAPAEDSSANPKSQIRNPKSDASRIAGLIPTGWFPGALALSADGRRLMVANTKGTGSRWAGNLLRAVLGYNTHLYSGTVSFIDLDPARLAEWTRTVRRADAVDATLADLSLRARRTPPVPVPARVGEPSLFHRVIYIIKENRTYDQVFGDLPQGNGAARLVQFGRKVTPNQHALAEQFVLLDNFYTCGVLSADGHQWTDEAYATEYLEKSFGDWPRSYPFEGEDALAIAPTGFLWDNALSHGLSFRDYGEMVHAQITPPGATWTDLWQERQHPTGRYKITPHPAVARLRDYVRQGTVGFPLVLNDQYRADRFLEDLHAADAGGSLPSLTIMLLPNDHTSGTRPGMPTPEAMVADNDMAVGRIVDAVSHSRFWKDTAIFVVEDDSQAGADHVDGHRSPALCISPYTRRGTVVHDFYTQISVVRTIEQVLGLRPMNGFDAAARPMFECFQPIADLTPYTALTNQIPLDQMNPPLSALRGPARQAALASMNIDFTEPDRADPQVLNRIIWHATKGLGVAYPAGAARDERFSGNPHTVMEVVKRKDHAH